MLRYSHVIWDWNGTLLDDTDYCVSIINGMLSKRDLRVFKDKSEYREVFGFPIEAYYRKVGFDFEKEPFSVLAQEYIDAYYAAADLKLHEGAREVLARLGEAGVTQSILSATEQNYLIRQIQPYGIDGYIKDAVGIGDICATSKIEAGKAYLARTNITRAVLIGDTEHDFQTANALGTDCILIAAGHHSRGKLERLGVRVVDSITEIPALVLDL